MGANPQASCVNLIIKDFKKFINLLILKQRVRVILPRLQITSRLIGRDSLMLQDDNLVFLLRQVIRQT
jgi:hypothetical protein